MVGTACVAIALAASVGHAQFKSTTTLLTLDASVIDHDGNPVPGLTAEDFEVTLDGKPQAVRAVSYVQVESASQLLAVDAPSADRAAPAPTVTVTTRDPRLFVLMLDDLTIRAGDAKGILVAAEQFIAALPKTDLVGFTTTSGLTVVNPTTDRTELLAKLRHATGGFFDFRDMPGPFVGMMESLQIDDGDRSLLLDIFKRECDIPDATLRSRTLEQLIADDPCAHDAEQRARTTARLARDNSKNQIQSIASIVTSMGATGGIKHLVVITGGVAVTTNTVDFVPVARAASAAGVQITFLTEMPDDVDMSTLRPARARSADNRALQASTEMLSDMSGGQMFRVVGQPKRFYDEVLRAASGVYRIGIELPSGAIPGADVVVSVKVKRTGASVHASRHAAVPAPAPPPPPVDEQLKDAIASGTPLYGVPVTLTPELFRPLNGDLTIRVRVEVPATVQGPLKGLFGLIDPAGKMQSGRRALQRLEGESNYKIEFLVPVPVDGTYRLRFAVADATGAVGSTEVRMTVAR